MATLTLEEIKRAAREHTITPAERRAQRVSLISGVLAKDTTLTRDKVESMLNQMEGLPAEVSKAES